MHALQLATRVPADSVMRRAPSYVRGGRVHGPAASVEGPLPPGKIEPLRSVGADASHEALRRELAEARGMIAALHDELALAGDTIEVLRRAGAACLAQIRHLEALLTFEADAVACDVLAAVAEAHGIRIEEVVARRRSRSLSWPRQMVCALLAEMRADMTLARIGMHVGGIDHTSVNYAIKAAHDRVRAGSVHASWPGLRQQFELPAELPALVRGRVWTLKRMETGDAA
ncbi:hypothetical protein FHP25_35975 [Vineibacter terrae]|uniref:Chromosomal replication initiator DnaA C-terminal domain-containing protein n=1 Tax=Vineibacter terrae TaxID=2586908 RepID=A0A5C8P8P9_9HYPH|nr:helix-turn-helix domain-containing protein [Vineibacter terrae]TXL70123.1 hypothetical protein FHP25_35975 [Vineibacter terrae]